MYGTFSKKSVYVVSIPWDSISVKQSFVFKKEKDAKTFCEVKNEKGYQGYQGGLIVEEVQIIESLES